MTDSVSPARYRFVPYGGGVEELDRFAVRERIRSGDIEAHTELSLAGGDEWRAAASYPELARYFELAATSSRRAIGQHLVTPSKPRELEPMQTRLIRGLLYPISGGEVFTLLGIAVISILPFFGWLASAAAAMIMLEIIRKSSDGRTKMPALVDTSDIGELIRVYIRVLMVTLISLAPVIAAGIWSFSAVLNKSAGSTTIIAVMLLASLLAAIYYPACLATVAVWDNVLSALNPAYVFRVINRIGGDYFIVIGAWLVASAVTYVLRFTSFAILAWIPFVGPIFSSMISLWVLFYASHLLGYAIYRHAPELGWE
jgi:hypothetical protein